ncbi:OmpA family protein [Nocardiopsis composta]
MERQRVLAGFATDSAELDAAMRESLESAAGLITEHGGPGTEVTITGHTDPTGPGDHNQELSEKRARAAAEHLRIALGENAQDIEITPAGTARTSRARTGPPPMLSCAASRSPTVCAPPRPRTGPWWKRARRSPPTPALPPPEEKSKKHSRNP